MRGEFSEWYTPAVRQGFRDQGLWRDLVVADYLDKTLPSKRDLLAVADGRREITFGELAESAYSLAENLRLRGVGPGVAVVVQLPNWWEAVAAYYAVALTGAVFVPRMPVYREAEMLEAVERTSATVLIVPSTYHKFDYLQMGTAIKDASDTLRHLIVVDPPAGADCLAFEDLVHGPHYAGPKASADDVHTVVFTSGTTAAPKGCAHTVNTLYTAAIVDWALFEITDDDVFFMPSSVMHTSGLVHGIVGPLIFGIPVVFQDSFEPREALRRVKHYRATGSMGATPFLKLMAEANDPEVDGLTTLRLFATGGAPMPGSVVRTVARRLGCAVVGAFGQSESPVITTTRIGDSIDRVASSDGRPTRTCEVVIMDDRGTVVPFGVEGEICSRGAQVMLGYWEDPQATAATIDSDGWCHSGDLGRMEESGDIRVTGRMKDVIVRGGHNISSAEIEEYLLENPRVRDVAVVGYPDDKLGERVCAFVVTKDDTPLDLDELVGPLRHKGIQIQKFPERCVVVTELPRSVVGKVDKKELRRRLEGDDTPEA